MSLLADDSVTDPQSPTDAELLDRIRAGDEAAFADMYRRYHGIARRYAARLASPAVSAEDVVSEAFVRVLSAIRGGAGPRDGFKLYLFTAVRRTAQRFRRAQFAVPVGTQELLEEPLHDDGLRLDGLEDPDLEAALRELPQRWQRVLARLEVEGADLRVVADEFGLSNSATSALAYRARRALRSAYLAKTS